MISMRTRRDVARFNIRSVESCTAAQIPLARLVFKEKVSIFALSNRVLLPNDSIAQVFGKFNVSIFALSNRVLLPAVKRQQSHKFFRVSIFALSNRVLLPTEF